MKLTDEKQIGTNIRSTKRFRLRKEISGWLFLIPTVFLMYVLIWRPTVLGFVWSFFKMNAYTVGEFIGLKNYELVLKHSQFFPMLKNTFMYIFWSLTIGFIPPILLAIMINEVVYFKKTARVLIYLPVVIPGIVAFLLWKYAYAPDETGLFNQILISMGFDKYGWLNDPNFTIIGIILQSMWKNMGASMLLYYACLQSISPELYEAAIIDGASPLKRVWHITRPALFPMMLLNFVRQIIGMFQTIDGPLTMTGGGPDGASTTLGYQLYLYAFNSGGRATGQAMALGVIMFVILLVATLFYFKLNKKIEENY